LREVKTTFVVDSSKSPYAKLLPVPVENVRLEDSFWVPRQRILREVTLPSQHKLLEDTGRVFNFRRASGKERGDFKGLFFNDSDVYKWVEAVAFVLATAFDKDLHDGAKQVVLDIVASQDEDGYLNSYFTFERKKDRWTNLRDMHELYCAGHLAQAAIALFRATRDRNLLYAACRVADHIASIFGSQKRLGTPGHPEIEMALVELYRTTGNGAYLDLARFLIDERGKGLIGGGIVHIDHKPFRQLSTVDGHAVRSLYLNAGATDVYLETGDKSLWATLLRLWHNMTERRMYLTGGVGARHVGEAFGEDYELPNVTAYAETCAAIANVMWNWRMLLATGEARFADTMETALYNGVLSGISLDGREYFYVNPLADRGKRRRQAWFPCACCPPNIARLLASLSGYVYSLSNEGIWVNLYTQSTANLEVWGNSVVLVQRTDYPWNGEVEIILQPQMETAFSIFLRIPGWCRSAQVQVNEKAIAENGQPGTYLEVRRVWRPGDRLQLSFAMPVERVFCQPLVMENADRVALKRGPLVYCAEQVDNADCDVWDLVLPYDCQLESRWKSDLLNGVVVISGDALAAGTELGEQLYRVATDAPPKMHRVSFTAVPYYAWANREPGPMIVWIRSTTCPLNG